jgi:hypothetical protein
MRPTRPAPARGRARPLHTQGQPPGLLRDRWHRGPKWVGAHRGRTDARTGHTADITETTERTRQSNRHVSGDPGTVCARMTGQGEQTWWLVVGGVAGCTGVAWTLGLDTQQTSRRARGAHARATDMSVATQRRPVHAWWARGSRPGGWWWARWPVAVEWWRSGVQGVRLSSPRPATVHPC